MSAVVSGATRRTLPDDMHCTTDMVATFYEVRFGALWIGRAGPGLAGHLKRLRPGAGTPGRR